MMHTRLFFALVILLLTSTAAHAQESGTQGQYQGMTKDEAIREAQRMGIDLSNPAEALRRARNMGISESRMKQIMEAHGGTGLSLDWQDQGQSAQQQQSDPREGRRSDMTAAEAQQEARRLGLDLSDPEAARRRARDLGIPESKVEELLAAYSRGQSKRGRAAQKEFPAPDLVRLPEISPASVKLEDGATLVSATVMLRTGKAPSGSSGFVPNSNIGRTQQSDASSGAAQARNSTRDVSGGASQQGRTAQDSVSTQGLFASSSAAYGSDLDLYLLSASRKDTIPAQRVQRVLSGAGQEVWMGTFLVPPTVKPGTWSLVVETLDETGQTVGRMDPSGFLKVEGEQIQDLQHFGYSIFEQGAQSVQGEHIGPVSDGYVVSPDDELRLTVWGAAEFQYDLQVDPEGRVYVPNVGQLTVAGKRVDELRRDVRLWLSRRYAGLVDEPPSVQMDLTVTRMRPLQVFVLGEVAQPGSYTVPSGASVFSALYEVGGPLERGSLRHVEIIRGDRVASVDLYDYLLRGFAPGSVQLQTGDHVFIPPRQKTVAIEGAVRRPAIYELKQGETIEDLIAFAGGLNAEADIRRFQVERILPFRERRDPARVHDIIDFSLADALAGRDSVTLEDGDHVQIFSVPKSSNLAAQRSVPVAKVAGAVLSPGRYEMNGSVRTLRDLLDTAGGLTGDAYLRKAELVRLREDLEREIVNVDVEKVLSDVPTHNLVLRPQDSLYIFSNQAMRAPRSVKISGKVRNPGEFEILEGMTVADLLLQAGGLYDPEYRKDVFLGRADLYRRSADGSSERILAFDLEAALDGEGFAGELLRPEDEIRIYAADVQEVRDRFVTISGAVKDPGTFPYREGMSLEDLVLQAGGFREDARRQEIEVTRSDPEATGSETITALNVDFSAPAAFTGAHFTSDHFYASRDSVGVGSLNAGFALQHRDRVYVRTLPGFHKEQKTVRIHGEVAYPGEYTLMGPNEMLSSVIHRAGGILPTGYAKGGELRRNSKRLVVEMDQALRGEREYDIILQPGDEIAIPARPNHVSVLGNVGREVEIKYVPGKTASYYIERAGGLREYTEAVLLTQASGDTYKLRVKQRRDLIYTREDPLVEDGASIRALIEPEVSLEQEKERIDWVRVTQTLLGVASSTLTILILYNRLK